MEWVSYLLTSVVTFAVVSAAGIKFDSMLTGRGRKSILRRKPRPAVNAIEDLTSWKAKRRLEDRREFRKRWEEIDPHKYDTRYYFDEAAQERYELQMFEKRIRWKEVKKGKPDGSAKKPYVKVENGGYVAKAEYDQFHQKLRLLDANGKVVAEYDGTPQSDRF